MRKLTVFLALILASNVFANDLLKGGGVGTSPSGSSISSAYLVKPSSGQIQGTFTFAPSATETYNSFASSMTVCYNTKNVYFASGGLEGFYTKGTFKEIIGGTFLVTGPQGSKGTLAVQFWDWTTHKPLFTLTQYNQITGGWGFAGGKCQ